MTKVVCSLKKDLESTQQALLAHGKAGATRPLAYAGPLRPDDHDAERDAGKLVHAAAQMILVVSDAAKVTARTTC